MKKNLFAAIAALFVMSAHAQEDADAPQSVRFGLKAGLNLATLQGDVSNPSMRPGALFGVTAEFRISDKFSIQPELLYSMQGVVEDVNEDLFGEIISGEGTTKLDYLNLPILAKTKLSKGFTVEVGPQIGLLLSAKIKYDMTYQGENISGTEDISKEVKSVDFAFNAGFGYELPSGVFFQGRYSLGLSNIYDGDDDVEAKNGVLQFSIGYKL